MREFDDFERHVETAFKQADVIFTQHRPEHWVPQQLLVPRDTVSVLSRWFDAEVEKEMYVVQTQNLSPTRVDRAKKNLHEESTIRMMQDRFGRPLRDGSQTILPIKLNFEEMQGIVRTLFSTLRKFPPGRVPTMRDEIIAVSELHSKYVHKGGKTTLRTTVQLSGSLIKAIAG